jgi:probable rRNA maturation factor
MNRKEKISIYISSVYHRNHNDTEIKKIRELTKYICGIFNIKNAQISISIVNDSQMVELNQTVLGKNTKTDVISFDLSDDIDPENHKNDNIANKNESEKVFDITINADRAEREARKRGHSQIAELALYLTHGLLHNLGCNDDTPQNSRKMHQKEDDILQQAGFGIVYKN